MEYRPWSNLFTFYSLVSKIEKNISDHSEFTKAKDSLQDWITRAREDIEDCVGDGDLDWINDKLETLTSVSERMSEGINTYFLSTSFHL